MPAPSEGSSDSEFLLPVSRSPDTSPESQCAYLNSISPTIYRLALQTDLRKPSFCASLLKLSSASPMARGSA